MRKTFIAGIVTVLAVALWPASPPADAGVAVSFDFFHSKLAPHGRWLVSAELGRVWQPAVHRRGWNPYHDGHWVRSDGGWMWISDHHEWGSVPYRYGTWARDPRFGWVWVPGYEWAPSWVVFRTGPDYVGWAPVPPRFRAGAAVRFDDDPDVFVFVGTRDFLAPRIRTHAVPGARARHAFRHTRFDDRHRGPEWRDDRRRRDDARERSERSRRGPERGERGRRR